MSLFTGVYLAYNFVIVLANERFMGVFFEKRRTSLPLWLGAYLLNYVLSSLAFLLFALPILSLGIMILTLFVITLTYEARMIKRLIALVCICVCGIAVDVIVFVAMVNPLSVFVAGVGFDITIYHLTIDGFLFYSAALLLRKFKNIKKSTISSPMLLIATIIVPIASMLSIVIIGTQMPQAPALIIVAIVFAINILFFLFQDSLSAAYADKLKSALHEQEKDYYLFQLQLMQQSSEQVKTIRHDMKLHLATLRDFSVGNKEAEDYLNRLLGDIGKGEVYSDTGNIAVDSIIKFKLKTAVENNIQTDIDVFVDPTLKVEVADIVTILGNFLDNALEAVSKVDDKRIKLHITSNKGNVLIKVENTFDGVVQYAKDGQTIVTRKVCGNHGHGLRNIQRAVEKYDGHVEIGHEDGVFRVGVLLYV